MQNVTTFTKKFSTRPAAKMRKKIRNWVTHVQRASSLYDGDCMQKAVPIKAKARPHLRLIKTGAKVGMLALALLSASDMYAAGGFIGDDTDTNSNAGSVIGASTVMDKLKEVRKVVDGGITDGLITAISDVQGNWSNNHASVVRTYGLFGDEATMNTKTHMKDKVLEIIKLLDSTSPATIIAGYNNAALKIKGTHASITATGLVQSAQEAANLIAITTGQNIGDTLTAVQNKIEGDRTDMTGPSLEGYAQDAASLLSPTANVDIGDAITEIMG